MNREPHGFRPWEDVNDPRTWGAAGWVSDVLPHLAYGLAAATAYEALAGRAG